MPKRRDRPPGSPGRINWPKFPKRKRDYGAKPKGPVQMGSVISSFGINAIDLKLIEYRLRKCWAEAVGAKIAKRAEPLMLIDSTLHCIVSSSPWITELNFQKAAIIEKINSAMGTSTVTEIIFKPGTLKGTTEPPTMSEPVAVEAKELTAEQKRHIEETAAEIEDPELKKSVMRAMERAVLAEIPEE
ncbi:MAG: DUF721 domain-containing protein [Proteobacteria bacterium]|nr:DUF721 domain-containing protein [Pseudomonadota bacterium]